MAPPGTPATGGGAGSSAKSSRRRAPWTSPRRSARSGASAADSGDTPRSAGGRATRGRPAPSTTPGRRLRSGGELPEEACSSSSHTARRTLSTARHAAAASRKDLTARVSISSNGDEDTPVPESSARTPRRGRGRTDAKGSGNTPARRKIFSGSNIPNDKDQTNGLRTSKVADADHSEGSRQGSNLKQSENRDWESMRCEDLRAEFRSRGWTWRGKKRAELVTELVDVCAPSLLSDAILEDVRQKTEVSSGGTDVKINAPTDWECGEASSPLVSKELRRPENGTTDTNVVSLESANSELEARSEVKEALAPKAVSDSSVKDDPADISRGTELAPKETRARLSGREGVDFLSERARTSKEVDGDSSERSRQDSNPKQCESRDWESMRCEDLRAEFRTRGWTWEGKKNAELVAELTNVCAPSLSDAIPEDVQPTTEVSSGGTDVKINAPTDWECGEASSPLVVEELRRPENGIAGANITSLESANSELELRSEVEEVLASKAASDSSVTNDFVDTGCGTELAPKETRAHLSGRVGIDLLSEGTGCRIIGAIEAPKTQPVLSPANIESQLTSAPTLMARTDLVPTAPRTNESIAPDHDALTRPSSSMTSEFNNARKAPGAARAAKSRRSWGELGSMRTGDGNHKLSPVVGQFDDCEPDLGGTTHEIPSALRKRGAPQSVEEKLCVRGSPEETPASSESIANMVARVRRVNLERLKRAVSDAEEAIGSAEAEATVVTDRKIRASSRKSITPPSKPSLSISEQKLRRVINRHAEIVAETAYLFERDVNTEADDGIATLVPGIYELARESATRNEVALKNRERSNEATSLTANASSDEATGLSQDRTAPPLPAMFLGGRAFRQDVGELNGLVTRATRVVGMWTRHLCEKDRISASDYTDDYEVKDEALKWAKLYDAVVRHVEHTILGEADGCAEEEKKQSDEIAASAKDDKMCKLKAVETRILIHYVNFPDSSDRWVVLDENGDGIGCNESSSVTIVPRGCHQASVSALRRFKGVSESDEESAEDSDVEKEDHDESATRRDESSENAESAANTVAIDSPNLQGASRKQKRWTEGEDEILLSAVNSRTDGGSVKSLRRNFWEKLVKETLPNRGWIAAKDRHKRILRNKEKGKSIANRIGDKTSDKAAEKLAGKSGDTNDKADSIGGGGAELTTAEVSRFLGGSKGVSTTTTEACQHPENSLAKGVEPRESKHTKTSNKWKEHEDASIARAVKAALRKGIIKGFKSIPGQFWGDLADGDLSYRGLKAIKRRWYDIRSQHFNDDGDPLVDDEDADLVAPNAADIDVQLSQDCGDSCGAGDDPAKQRKNKGTKRKGEWTAREDQLITDSVNSHPAPQQRSMKHVFLRLEQSLPGRSLAAIGNRWQGTLKKRDTSPEGSSKKETTLRSDGNGKKRSAPAVRASDGRTKKKRKGSKDQAQESKACKVVESSDPISQSSPKKRSLADANAEVCKEDIFLKSDDKTEANTPQKKDERITVDDDSNLEFTWICTECREAECVEDPDSPLLVCEGQCDRPFHIPCAGLPGIPHKDETWICSDCSNRRHKCGVCHEYGNDGEDVHKCEKKKCGLFFHESCLTMYDVDVVVEESTAEAERQDDEASAPITVKPKFTCPAHSCWTCSFTPPGPIDDLDGKTKDPKTKKRRGKKKSISATFGVKKEKLFSCLDCPISYHITCIPPACRFHELALLCHEHRENKLPDLDVENSFQAKVEAAADKKIKEFRKKRLKKSEPTDSSSDDDSDAELEDESNSFLPRMHGDTVSSEQQQLMGMLYDSDENPGKRSGLKQNQLLFCLPCDFQQEVHSKPPSYTHVHSNRYDQSNRPRRHPPSNERCQCDPSADPGVSACDEHCMNQLVMMECCGDGNRANGTTNPYWNCNIGPNCGNRKLSQRKFAKCKPKREQGKGWGLITVNGVKERDLVTEYVGEIIDKETKIERLSGWAKDHPNDPNFYIMHLEPGWYIDARVKGNLSRFINHSCDPNCKLVPVNTAGNMRVAIIALRGVAPGEHLSYDYQFDTNDADRFICRCGAAKCRGTMKGGGRGDQLEKEAKKTKRELWLEAKARYDRDKKFLDDVLKDEKQRLCLVRQTAPGEQKDSSVMVASGPQWKDRDYALQHHIFLWRTALLGSDFSARSLRRPEVQHNRNTSTKQPSIDMLAAMDKSCSSSMRP